MALTEEEERKVRAIIAIFDGIAPSLSADVAQKSAELFPEWDADGHAYTVGERIKYEGVLYQCLQVHTSQPDWSPTAAPSLWTKVLDSGTPDTPIEDIPEWKQPTAENPYGLGARVKHKGKVWESLVEKNVWEPGVVGTESVWREVAEG